MAGFVDESLKRSSNDICLYITKPGEGSRKMVLYKPGDTWQTFLDAVSSRLEIQVSRIFNSHDEIKSVNDLVQGDVLFVAGLASDNGSPASPLEIRGRGVWKLKWIRVTRLVLLQCVEGYVITEPVKKDKYSETLRARRISDASLVIIKRVAARPALCLNTLKSCIPQCWAIRHPHFAHYVDILDTHHLRRPLGSASAIRRARKLGGCDVMVMVLERFETSLDLVLKEHINLQKSVPIEQITIWTLQILKVLQYLHSEVRVAHRNLKLSNILVDTSGHALLSDVGLPKADPGATAYHMRNACKNCCAFRKGHIAPYMEHISPEAFCSGCTTEKDDIWALGCIVTELVTQKLVSERVHGEMFGRNQGAVAQAVAEVTIKDVKLGKLCRVLLEVEPSKRPTAMEVLSQHMRGLTEVPFSDIIPLTATEISEVKSLGKSNDIPTLISAILKDGAFQACEAASARLNEILYQEPAKRICMSDVYSTPFGRMTGMTALCQCLIRGSPLAQQRAASAIRNALLEDENERHMGLAEIQALVAALTTGTPTTQGNAAAALANVCATQKQMRDYVNLTGGIGALAALVASCTTEHMTSTNLLNGAILEAASAVRNACIGHAANRDDWMKSQGVEAFVKVLNCSSQVPANLREKQLMMQEQVAGALRNACNQHTGNCMLFNESDGVPSMMRLLTSPSPSVQEEVVGLIRNSCVGYYGNKDHMAYCGVFWSFSQMLNQPSLARAVKEEIVSAIHYSTVGHEVNKQAAGEAGLLRALVAMLHSGRNEANNRAKIEVAACLRILCDESESNSAEMVKCSGISALLDLLATGSAIAKEEAIAAIANACSAHPRNADWITEKARIYLQDVINSTEFSDESKLFAKCILITWQTTRQKHSILSLKEGDTGLGGISKSWCPQHTKKGRDELIVSVAKMPLALGPEPACLPRILPRIKAKTTSLPEEGAAWRWPERPLLHANVPRGNYTQLRF